jgi:hypothetical protein
VWEILKSDEIERHNANSKAEDAIKKVDQEAIRPNERDEWNETRNPKRIDTAHNTRQLLRIAVTNAAAVRENAAFGHKLEHVRQRQKANVDIVGGDARQHGLRGAAARGHQILVRDDDALGHAGGARGVPVVAGDEERDARESRESRVRRSESKSKRADGQRGNEQEIVMRESERKLIRIREPSSTAFMHTLCDTEKTHESSRF